MLHLKTQTVYRILPDRGMETEQIRIFNIIVKYPMFPIWQKAIRARRRIPHIEYVRVLPQLDLPVRKNITICLQTPNHHLRRSSHSSMMLLAAC